MLSADGGGRGNSTPVRRTFNRTLCRWDSGAGTGDTACLGP